MFYFIEEIPTAEVMINWARMISENIDAQLRDMRKTKQFYMSSYIV